MSLPLPPRTTDIVVYAWPERRQFPDGARRRASVALTEPWDFFLFDDLLQDAVERINHQPRRVPLAAPHYPGQGGWSGHWPSPHARPVTTSVRTSSWDDGSPITRTGVACPHCRAHSERQRRENGRRSERRKRSHVGSRVSGGQRQVLGHSEPWKAVLKRRRGRSTGRRCCCWANPAQAK
jgi:hypothetical protein